VFEAFPLILNPWLPVGVLWSTFLLIPESELPPGTRLPVPNPARIELLGWTGHTSSTNHLPPGAPVRLPKETRLEGYGEMASEACEESERSVVY
jgi:hypothetical protein